MSKVETLRTLLNERLTAVVEEICGLFETTIAEYEEKLSGSKDEAEQQRELNAAVDQGLEMHKADIQQVSVNKRQQPHHYCSIPIFESIVDQKEALDELWCCQRGQQLVGQENTPFSGVPATVFPADTQQVARVEQASSKQQEWTPTLEQKDPEPSQSKDDLETPCRSLDGEQKGAEENREMDSPANSSAQQMESNREDCGRAEPVSHSDSEKTVDSSECETEDSDDDWKRLPTQQSNFKLLKDAKVPGSEPASKVVPASDLKPATDIKPYHNFQPSSEHKPSDSSETEDSDDDWKHKPQPVLPTVKPKVAPESSSKFSHQTDRTSFSCSVCGKRFQLEQQLKRHTKTHSQKTNLPRSECGKHFSHEVNLNRHTRSHSADKLLNGSMSKKSQDSPPVKRHKTKQKSCLCSL